jgi:hypothetical protein
MAESLQSRHGFTVFRFDFQDKTSGYASDIAKRQENTISLCHSKPSFILLVVDQRPLFLHIAGCTFAR